MSEHHPDQLTSAEVAELRGLEAIGYHRHMAARHLAMCDQLDSITARAARAAAADAHTNAARLVLELRVAMNAGEL